LKPLATPFACAPRNCGQSDDPASCPAKAECKLSDSDKAKAQDREFIS